MPHVPHRTKALLCGSATFVDDLAVPGALHAAIVRSPVAAGQVVQLDTGSARELSGVRAVYTADDLGSMPLLPVRSSPFPGIERSMPPILATDEVRYVGQPLAIVVAETSYLAEDAIDRVRVDIEPREAITDARQSTDQLCGFLSDSGDVDVAFGEAALIIEEQFTIQRQTAVPLETRGLAASWDEKSGALDVWGVTKYVQFARTSLAHFFAIDPNQVACHATAVGGMFGVRGELYAEDYLIPWAARQLAHPVRWTEDRREHLTAINHSREQHHHVRMALDERGGVLAFTDHITLDMGAYANSIGGRLAEMTIASLPGPYAWRAYTIRLDGMRTNKTPVGVIRGPATFEATFVRERMLDIAAHRLGIPPIELRRRNLLTSADLPHRLNLGPDVPDATYDSGAYAAVLDRLVDDVEVKDRLVDVRHRQSRGELVGAGIALFLNHSGHGATESIGMTLTEEGRVVVSTSGCDVGQGFDEMVRSVTSRTLGIAPSTIDVMSGSSYAHEGGSGTFSSRSTIFVGSAAESAGKQLLMEARRRAALLSGSHLDEVSTSLDGVRDGVNVWSWKELGRIDVTGHHEQEEPTFGFGAHLAVVRIDAETAGLTLEHITVAYDCGRAIDRENALQQLLGGTAQAIGQSTLEELVYDQAGQPQSTTFMDYLLPTCADVGAIDPILLELAPAPSNPLGAKGVGEAGVYGVAGALANAVADALHLDGGCTSLPLSPAAIHPLLLQEQG